MNAPEIIRKKRDGQELSREEMAAFIAGVTRGEIPDYQAAALLMAIYFRGLSARETTDLTEAMMRSGRTLSFPEFPEPKVDKHSTGGVGDKTSLVVAPAAAAAGLRVPMISGRGLGHTGGTLDKLESIPGFNVRLTLEQFRRVLGVCGLALMGPTPDLVPADRKLYALRDVTATVESLPLISASIMSKKLAEGIGGLTLDVKTGSGAFMKRREDSEALARRMVEIGEARGLRVEAFITGMNQPLGHAVGNSLEVIECLETMKGRGPADLNELCRELTASMLITGGIETSRQRARERYDVLIRNGQALRRFQSVIEEQGGEPSIVEDDHLLPRAEHQESLVAWENGFLRAIEAEAAGRAAMALGAGRERLDAVIDHAVGLVFEKKVGDAVSVGERICVLHWNDAAKLDRARRILRRAVDIGPEPPPAEPLIWARISDSRQGAEPE